MIKVCEHCSNVDVNELKKRFGEDEVQVGCIENCAAYKTEAYGYVGEELVVADTFELWLEKIEK